MPILTPDQFKAAVRQKKLPADVTLHKQMSSAVIVPQADRQLQFVLSTAGIDRAKDVVLQDGWQLMNYRANPVVLWGHDASQMPLAKAVEIYVVDDRLIATVEFVPADVPEVGTKAEAVLQLYKSGFLSAVSVGFRPLTFEIAEDRDDDSYFPPMNFITQELTEFSFVTIPCNPEALIMVPETTADLLAQQSADDQADLAQEAQRAAEAEQTKAINEAAEDSIRRMHARTRGARRRDLLTALSLT